MSSSWSPSAHRPAQHLDSFIVLRVFMRFQRFVGGAYGVIFVMVLLFTINLDWRLIALIYLFTGQ